MRGTAVDGGTNWAMGIGALFWRACSLATSIDYVWRRTDAKNGYKYEFGKSRKIMSEYIQQAFRGKLNRTRAYLSSQYILKLDD